MTRKEFNIKNILMKYGYCKILPIGAIFFVVLAMVYCLGDESVVLGKPKILLQPYNFTGKVDIKLHDGTIYHKKVPFVIKTDQPFDVVLNLKDIGMIDGKTLSFVSKDTVLRCEVDKNVIYRSVSTYSDSRYQDGNMIYLIDLPNEIEKNEITLRYEYYKEYKTYFELSDVKIGQKTDIISYYFLQENVRSVILILLIVTMFFGVVITGNFFRECSPIEKYFNYIALLCACLGVYIFSTLPLSYFVLYKIGVILHILKYSSLMILPIPLLKGVLPRIDEKYHIYLRFGIILASVNTILQHGLVLSKKETLTVLVPYSYVVMIYAMVVILYTSFRTKDKSENRIYKMIATLLPLFVGLVGEILKAVFKSEAYRFSFFRIFIFLFVLAQGREFILFYREVRDKKMKAELYKKLAFLDGLTGVGNRMAFLDNVSKYENGEYAFYCIVMDIDNLKYINDRYGHKYGDEIIVSFANLLKRSFDSKYEKEIFRMGGDEFMVLYHAPKNVNVESVLQSIEVEYTETKIDDGKIHEFGVSYGYSYYESGKGIEVEDAMDRADKNMYVYKSNKKANRR